MTIHVKGFNRKINTPYSNIDRGNNILYLKMNVRKVQENVCNGMYGIYI